MKKRLLLASLGIVVFACLHAQIPKGSVLLGGDLSLGFGKITTGNVSTNRNNISFTPSFAKAIKENLFVGGSVAVGASKDDGFAYLNKSNSFSAGVFIRKYKPIKNGFYIFGQGNLGGLYTKNESTSGDIVYTTTTQKVTTFGISVSPGISYAISNKFHLEAGFNNLLSLNYSNFRSWSGGSATTTVYSKQNGVSLNTSLNNMSSQLFMGFRVLLQKQQK